MVNDAIQDLVDAAEPEGANAICEHRVVVRLNDGSLIKGVIRAHVLSPNPMAIPPLPTVLTVLDDSKKEAIATVDLADVKAVFFVRSYAGDHGYQEVQFFGKRIPSDVWVQVRLTDGEALEGRIENCIRLLTGPGFWLWPADVIANNRLVYIPKDSIAEFHVTGVGATRAVQSAAQLTGRNACVR